MIDRQNIDLSIIILTCLWNNAVCSIFIYLSVCMVIAECVDMHYVAWYENISIALLPRTAQNNGHATSMNNIFHHSRLLYYGYFINGLCCFSYNRTWMVLVWFIDLVQYHWNASDETARLLLYVLIYKYNDKPINMMGNAIKQPVLL